MSIDITTLVRIAVGITTTAIVPIVFLLIRLANKWTRIELTLEQIGKDIQETVTNSDTAHQEIYREMREDRKATNSRLRFLEEHTWRKGQ